MYWRGLRPSDVRTSWPVSPTSWGRRTPESAHWSVTMLGQPRLNVCILAADISPRLRERLQAQVQTAIRSLPRWPFALLSRRMSELGVASLPLIVQPVNSVDAAHPLGLGDIE